MYGFPSKCDEGSSAQNPNEKDDTYETEYELIHRMKY
jgi:hypothetical protein